jgi:hypothetical protein
MMVPGLLLHIASVAVASVAPTPPHIVMFVSDDQGYHDMGFNNANISTPHLLSLASKGRILRQVSAWCTRSNTFLPLAPHLPTRSVTLSRERLSHWTSSEDRCSSFACLFTHAQACALETELVHQPRSLIHAALTRYSRVIHVLLAALRVQVLLTNKGIAALGPTAVPRTPVEPRRRTARRNTSQLHAPACQAQGMLWVRTAAS